MPSRICCCGVLFTNKGSFKYHVTTKHIAYRRLNMLKYCKTVDSNSSRAQTPGGMPTSSVVVASSSAATIPLEPTTIEDKRPMTIDVSTIKELNAAQTEYLVLEHASKLREIFEGKKYCRRHEDYKKGGKTRGDLAFQVHFGPFSEEQQDKIMEVLTNMFCCGHSEVMKLHSVLLIRLVVLGSSYCPKFRCHRKYVNIAR
ncbi:uncharacterized protein LOC122951733 isoform X1 [Acropora millepora]|uniref:uncharacterized protein LOC122951733 isoform X1 n=1 Tax=Acropora millepora TaxID=45264 RepID=UPI001CF281E2|nr:uncharacterized protein LOC122951733 isoform X1 [Acropora millepora]